MLNLKKTFKLVIISLITITIIAGCSSSHGAPSITPQEKKTEKQQPPCFDILKPFISGEQNSCTHEKHILCIEKVPGTTDIYVGCYCNRMPCQGRFDY